MIEQIIQKSRDPEALLKALEVLDEDDALDRMAPQMRREVEESTRLRSVGSSGLVRFSL